jgi:molecular chaperone DnaK (HSP70)
MIDIILQTTAITLVASLTSAFVVIKLKLNKSREEIKAEMSRSFLLMDELGKANDREAQAKLEKTDGFVKFLSDSRDWSFTYIENVQQAIQGLVKAMKANDKAKILESYNELQNFLPTEEDSNKKQGDNK